MTLSLKAFILSFVLASPLPIITLRDVPGAQNSPVSEVKVEVVVPIEKPDYTPLEACIKLKESNNNPKAVGQLGEYGLWQILPSTWDFYRCTGDPFNPVDNETCARKIIEDDGYRQWTTYKLCKEKEPDISGSF